MKDSKHQSPTQHPAYPSQLKEPLTKIFYASHRHFPRIEKGVFAEMNSSSVQAVCFTVTWIIATEI